LDGKEKSRKKGGEREEENEGSGLLRVVFLFFAIIRRIIFFVGLRGIIVSVVVAAAAVIVAAILIIRLIRGKIEVTDWQGIGPLFLIIRRRTKNFFSLAVSEKRNQNKQRKERGEKLKGEERRNSETQTACRIESVGSPIVVAVCPSVLRSFSSSFCISPSAR
jgi:hypothetical protein